MKDRFAETLSSTPLVSLTAVVFDTETTGLDAKTARIVQIGAVRIAQGRLDRADRFELFVDPGEPIPPASTRIHGICDADVAIADGFPGAFAKFRDWSADAVLIGYSTGFDLGMIKAETGRAGTSWTPPRCLDVRHLAQLLAPPLPDLALDTVAGWLDLEIEHRHSALGDAVATAEVYLKLVPKLCDKGIRTLAEAETACRRLSAQVTGEAQAGWHEVVRESEPERRSVAALARIDSFPYRHRIADIMASPPVTIAYSATMREALAVMMRDKISSVFVSADRSGDEGIITERDILRIVDADPEHALSRSTGDTAARPLKTVDESDYAYRAIARMNQERVRHLGVRNAAGHLVGAVTARDLLGQRAGDALSLGDEIEQARGVEELGLVWTKLTMVALGLSSEEVDPRDIAAIISNELRALTRQACIIAERELEDAGSGPPPRPYAMMILGSGGRGESLLAMDQDNAIVFDEGDPGGDADIWFEQLGRRVSDILNAVGVQHCKGGIMASNAEWRMSSPRWRETVAGWIGRSRPQDILNTDIFFDSISVHGEIALGEEIRDAALASAARSHDFLHLLAVNAADIRLPIGWFGRLQLDKGRVDLKMGGIMPIFSAARVLALRHRIAARSTPERLETACEHLPEKARTIGNLIDAHRILLGTILEQQLRDIELGIPLSNSVAPKELSKVRLDALKWAIEQVREVPPLLGSPNILR